MDHARKMKLTIPPGTKLYDLFYDFYDKINKNRRKKITKKEALDIFGFLLERIEIKYQDRDGGRFF